MVVARWLEKLYLQISRFKINNIFNYYKDVYGKLKDDLYLYTVDF